MQDEEILPDYYYGSVEIPEPFLKERDDFLIFFSRLITTYADTIHKFIEYKFEFCERTWVSSKQVKSYTTKIFIYTVKENQSDANYLLGLFSEHSNGWNMIESKIVIKDTKKVK